MTEVVIKKEVSRMPGWENAQPYDLNSFFGEVTVKGIKEGHLGGLLPNVKGMEASLRMLSTLQSQYIYTPSFIKVGENNNDLRAFLDGKYVYFGIENTFNKLQYGGIENLSKPTALSEDERKKCAENARAVPSLENLPLHTGNWKLASGNAEAVDFHMREVDGDVNANYGYFTLDLKQNSVLAHIDNKNTIKLPMLIEIASQQIASVLGNPENSPVMGQVELFIVDTTAGIDIYVGQEIKCDFRISKSGNKFNYSLVISGDGKGILSANIKATLIDNKILQRSIRMAN